MPAPQKKERRTKDAQRTQRKGRMKRALADAPYGARLKALFSFIKLAGFSLKQCLDARASIQIVTGQRSLTGESIITRRLQTAIVLEVGGNPDFLNDAKTVGWKRSRHFKS
jgi:hypothetical protein